MEHVEQDTRRILARLGWAWVAPELNRHNPTILDEVEDPVLLEAWHAIRDRQVTRYRRGPVWQILQLVQSDFSPEPELLGRLKRIWAKNNGRKLTVGELVSDLWPDREPEMVLPAVEGPLAGKWPKKPGHTCEHVWRADEQDDGYEVVHWTGRAWRGQICDACYYDRVYRFCRQLEWEMIQTEEPEDYRWLVILPSEYKKLTSNIRQHRRRKSADIRFLSLPQWTPAGYFVIHNDPDLEGNPLPNDRCELFDLLAQHSDTHPERLVGHSTDWGGPWSGTQGNGQANGQHRSKGESAEPGQTKKERISIIGQGIASLISWADELGYKVSGEGGKFKIDITTEQFIELLELREVKYSVLYGRERVSVVKGEVVTDHRQLDHSKNQLSEMRDKLPVGRVQTPLHLPENPAPIYL